jgi:hypothetical protein
LKVKPENICAKIIEVSNQRHLHMSHTARLSVGEAQFTALTLLESQLTFVPPECEVCSGFQRKYSPAETHEYDSGKGKPVTFSKESRALLTIDLEDLA